MRVPTRLVSIAAVAAFALASPPLQAAPQYTLFDLGALGSGSSTATQINDAGQVIGSFGATAFVDTPGLGVTDFATLAGQPAGTTSSAYGINSLGQVVGSVGAGSSVVYRPGVGTEYLAGGLGVRRINDVGQYIGEGYDGQAGFGYRYTPGTGVEPLPGLYSLVADINNQGQVAGVAAYTDDSIDHAARLDADGVQLLGDLGGGFSRSNAINNGGDVVGYAGVSSDLVHAFRYTDAGGIVDLDPSGLFHSMAEAINDQGLVGGTFWTTSDGTEKRAFIAGATSGLVDLNTLLDPSTGAGWTLLEVTDINNAGQIVGTGLFGGVERAFVLSAVAAPVPEPAAWLLALVAWPLLRRGARQAC